MMFETDRGKPQSDTDSFRLDPARVKLCDAPWAIELQLVDFKLAGLRTRYHIAGIGGGNVNETPYSDLETARAEHQKAVDAVREGRYSIEILGINRTRLILTES
jgi:hypothetical protein